MHDKLDPDKILIFDNASDSCQAILYTIIYIENVMGFLHDCKNIGTYR